MMTRLNKTESNSDRALQCNKLSEYLEIIMCFEFCWDSIYGRGVVDRLRQIFTYPDHLPRIFSFQIICSFENKVSVEANPGPQAFSFGPPKWPVKRVVCTGHKLTA